MHLRPMCVEHGARQGYSCYSRKAWRMKAVLEFQYPEDEQRLQHAMKGTEYYDALCEIDNILAMPYTKAEAYTKIKAVVFKTLEGV